MKSNKTKMNDLNFAKLMDTIGTSSSKPEILNKLSFQKKQYPHPFPGMILSELLSSHEEEEKNYFEANPAGIRFGDDELRFMTNIFDVLKYGDKPGFEVGTKLPNSNIILEMLINSYMQEFEPGRGEYSEIPGRGPQDIGFRISKRF